MNTNKLIYRTLLAFQRVMYTLNFIKRKHFVEVNSESLKGFFDSSYIKVIGTVFKRFIAHLRHRSWCIFIDPSFYQYKTTQL